MLVRDLLLLKLRTISSNATMFEAHRIMHDLRIRHLPVVNGNKIVGILSDRDVLLAMNKELASGSKQQIYVSRYKKVSEFMTSPVFKMKDSSDLREVVREMLDRKISSVIIEDENLNEVGIVTTDDLLLLFHENLTKDMKPRRKLLKWFLGFRWSGHSKSR